MRGRWGSRRVQFDFKKFIKLYFERIDLSAVKTLRYEKSDFEVADAGGDKKIEDLDYTDMGGIWTMESTTQFSKKPNNAPSGQIEFTSPGQYNWSPPPGVTSVCVVCVGGGGGGLYYGTSGASFTYTMNGGGGGGLGWKNNIPVVPGQSYTVVVGAGGITGQYATNSTAGGDSYFINISTVSGLGGLPGRYNSTILGGGFVGDGGGYGGTVVNTTSGSSGPLAGGGAGGYNGAGYGMSSATAATNTGNEDGGAVGDFSSTFMSNGGGGTGLQGTSVGSKPSFTDRGIGAYGGGAGFNQTGGFPGGGGGGSSSIYYTIGGNGGGGAVRIIWGTGRSFPSNAEDV